MSRRGNKNAQRGDNPASEFLHVRVLPTEKAKWRAAAARAGCTFSEWVRRSLNEAR